LASDHPECIGAARAGGQFNSWRSRWSVFLGEGQFFQNDMERFH
jgi:hypothetical protein